MKCCYGIFAVIYFHMAVVTACCRQLHATVILRPRHAQLETFLVTLKILTNFTYAVQQTKDQNKTENQSSYELFV